MASTADSACQWGLSQIGVCYKTGALFTQTAYSVVGVQIPRNAIAQAFRAGAEVPKGHYAPGDLIFPTTRIVQLYLGGGMVLGVTKAGVVRAPIRRVWRAVRVTTPGGGVGLALATTSNQTPKIISGRRGKSLT